MNFGKRTERAESLRIVARAFERAAAPGPLFDTANAYNGGDSERILGEALRAEPSRRDRCLVATKVGFVPGGGAAGLSRDKVLAACDASLSRLGLDVVDVYYLHVPDHATPLEETLGAMKELVDRGKVRAWGVSNYASWQVLEMFGIADHAGMPRPVIAQQIYNALVRQLDVEWFKFAKAHPIHTTVYNPLAGGLLAREHRPDHEPAAGSRFAGNVFYQRRYWTEPMFGAVEEMRGIAREAGLSLATLAYAWAKDRPGVDSVIAGPASVAHLDAAFDAMEVSLAPEVRAKVDAVYPRLVGTDTSYAR